jgi:hypothetical protein
MNRLVTFRDEELATDFTNVFVRSLPCRNRGKCIFCTYHRDNTSSYTEAMKENIDLIKRIPLDRTGWLNIAPSASIFEVPFDSLALLNRILPGAGFDWLCTETHWEYRHLIENLIGYFSMIPTRVKIGLETFDNTQRSRLGKPFTISGWREVRKFSDAVNLIVGVRGQTREVILEDLKIGGENFNYAEVNVFDSDLGPSGVADHEILKWFHEEGQHIARSYPSVKVWMNAKEYADE